MPVIVPSGCDHGFQYPQTTAQGVFDQLGLVPGSRLHPPCRLGSVFDDDPEKTGEIVVRIELGQIAFQV
jgi:hypothetical protein